MPIAYPTLVKSEIYDPVALVHSYMRHHPEDIQYPPLPEHDIRAPKAKKVLNGQVAAPAMVGLHAIPVLIPCDVPPPA
jgi:hypothetical protein